MRKIFYLFILCVLTISCDDLQDSSSVSITSGGYRFEVLEIDSCEYIFRSAPYKGFMVHKGNCKYCLESNKIWK